MSGYNYRPPHPPEMGSQPSPGGMAPRPWLPINWPPNGQNQMFPPQNQQGQPLSAHEDIPNVGPPPYPPSRELWTQDYNSMPSFPPPCPPPNFVPPSFPPPSFPEFREDPSPYFSSPQITPPDFRPLDPPLNPPISTPPLENFTPLCPYDQFYGPPREHFKPPQYQTEDSEVPADPMQNIGGNSFGRFRNVTYGCNVSRRNEDNSRFAGKSIGEAVPQHNSAATRNPQRASQESASTRRQSIRKRSRSPDPVRSSQRSRSPRKRSRRSPDGNRSSSRRSRSPKDRKSSSRTSSRRRSRSPGPGKTQQSSRSQLLGQPRTSRSPTRGRREDKEKDSDRRQPRKGSPISQTKRWNELEAKTTALQESFNPVNLKAHTDKEEVVSEDISSEDDPAWVQCSPRGNFYTADGKIQKNGSTVAATDKLKDLLGRFEEDVVNRGVRAREVQPKLEIPQPKVHWHTHKDCEHDISDEDDSSSSSDDDEGDGDDPLAFLKMKQKHPARLAENLWFNDPGEVNDGPLCRCSNKARQVGIRHNIYPGEEPIPLCDPYTNNAGRLHHYRITLAPSTNFLTHQPTVIEYDDREYIFEGFSLFSHTKLDNIPPCKVVRFNIEYSIIFMEEPMPENFTAKGLDLFGDFLFFEILELYDFELVGKVGGCKFFHFMPRFARQLPSNGKEILSMHHVIQHLLGMNRPVVDPKDLQGWLECDQLTWERYAEELKGMIITCPGKKPSSVRVDQIDREHEQKATDGEQSQDKYPTIVHFGLRPAQLSYAGNKDYQNLFKSYLKMNHLLANKPKVSIQDRQKLAEKEKRLQRIRLQGHMTREVTAEICSRDILMTGIGSDVCQHAMMLPVLVNHIRYFNCLYNIDDIIGYKFKDRVLLKHAMTHPSYRLTYGMNPDHVRNSLYNCGIRQPDYGDKKKQVERSRKKGINTLIKIMSEMAAPEELSSHIHHYERLEFLGDAVVEFVTSTHLYYLFPHLEEGGLATYRQAIVQNQHLAVLARKLELERFLLYAHGPDLCRSSDLKHALANCLEALMGALYLEGGIPVVRRIFCNLLFDTEKLRNIWMHHPKHPLQLEFPQGDRHMIQYSSILQMLHKFEESTGIKFKHIRLLARAFTQRTMSYTNLTRGHNQRMEFLGDTVLQLITSSYLYKHFPNHHEGHLSLLRSSLVNNKTQSTVASDLGMSTYIIDAKNRTLEDGGPLPTKLLADLLEAFVGAMYVDQGTAAVTVFCSVCFFPRLKDFIFSQHWNDAKSQLQQCCLTLRTEGKEPDVPQYKVISQHGPTNNRVYNVAVYFREKRLGTGSASNTQDAQMEAARDALQNYNFPQLHHQRMVIERKYVQDSKERAPSQGKKYGPMD